MSVIYAVALGHDVAEASLTPLNPQPGSVGSIPGRRIYAAGGGYYEDLHVMELKWDVLEDGEDYRSLLVQLGLNEADTAEITLQGRDDNFLAWVVNAVVYRPEHGRELGWATPFAQRLTILARDLAEVSA